MDDSRELGELRQSIADVDRAMLELMRRRMELAARVGRVKAEAGTPVVVADVEDAVLGRAREHAEACGVSEEVMEAVFRAVIRGSVERQHRVGVELRARCGSRVLIVGGAGAMGGWFARLFQAIGHSVERLDPALRDLPPAPGAFASLADAGDLDRFDAIVVSAPLGRTPEVIAGLTGARPRGAVVEIASIKAHLEPALDDAAKARVRVVSLHPMFGPGKSLYDSLTFVHAWRADEACERALLEPLLSHPYTSLIPVPFAHHDRLMGWLLGLAHLTGILFGSALARSGLPADELRACASTTFQRQAATASSILGEDPALYLDIQRLNPYRDVVYKAVRSALDELSGAVAGNDAEAFRAAMSAARSALGS